MQFPPDEFIAPACAQAIEILFADEYLLLINKPSGLLSLSGKNPLNLDSVHYRLVQDYPSAQLVHRLDFGTSGIMIIALSKSVNAHIGRQFQLGQVQKTYTALLNGNLPADTGHWDFPIAKDIEHFPKQKICALTGKLANTYFAVQSRETNPAVTRVLFTPKTGRTHQLRMHASHAGYPILGDDIYANSEIAKSVPRLMLHASSIHFLHPITLEMMTGECSCPF